MLHNERRGGGRGRGGLREQSLAQEEQKAFHLFAKRKRTHCLASSPPQFRRKKRENEKAGLDKDEEDSAPDWPNIRQKKYSFKKVFHGQTRFFLSRGGPLLSPSPV